MYKIYFIFIPKIIPIYTTILHALNAKHNYCAVYTIFGDKVTNL